jgi:tetratricopeptide (TPR) repeat protein
LSKINAIRKKALDSVRKQDWLSAIKEYTRLADLDQSNPNVFNELGDIYLKTGNKNDAYDAFVHAIDSYTRVSLHNNAVAVCKKVRRLIPARYEVLTKLGLIRKKQGLAKEAESYYNTFLDQLLADQGIGPGEVTTISAEIADEMGTSSSVLARLYECMVKFNLKEETADVLQKLYDAYAADGNETGRNETSQKMTELGMNVEKAPVAAPQEGKDGAIITEENIWSAAHTEGERMSPNDPDHEDQPAAPASAQDTRPDSVFEFGEVKMDAAGSAVTSTQTMPDPQETVPEAGAPDVVAGEYVIDAGETEEEAEVATEYDITPGDDTAVAPQADVTEESPAPAAVPPQPDTPPVAPETVAAETVAPADPPVDAPVSPEPPIEQEQVVADPMSSGIASSPDQVHVSAIIGEISDQEGEMTEEDYRSHYDLGMAYLEMDLLAEAVREYQLSSKSEAYQARALEMIGLCFLRQNQPNLAIKQLTKGLQMINVDDTESLGIKYNLGLAYEMVGNVEQALGAFEDVYVEDVTFREVAQKIEKYS